jgi:peroxiredoxin
MAASGSIIELPRMQVADWQGKPVTLDYSLAQYNILILFNSSTCAGFYEERSVWEAIVKEHDSKEVRIIGILLDDSDPKAIAERYNFGFPVYKDVNGDAKRTMDYGQYPMKFIVDATGKVLHIDWPSRFKERKDNIKKELDYIIYLLAR